MAYMLICADMLLTDRRDNTECAILQDLLLQSENIGKYVHKMDKQKLIDAVQVALNDKKHEHYDYKVLSVSIVSKKIEQVLDI